MLSLKLVKNQHHKYRENGSLEKETTYRQTYDKGIGKGKTQFE